MRGSYERDGGAAVGLREADFRSMMSKMSDLTVEPDLKNKPRH